MSNSVLIERFTTEGVTFSRHNEQFYRNDGSIEHEITASDYFKVKMLLNK
jgi:hypothetical protein